MWWSLAVVNPDILRMAMGDNDELMPSAVEVKAPPAPAVDDDESSISMFALTDSTVLGHPCMCLATISGQSILICHRMSRFLQQHPWLAILPSLPQLMLSLQHLLCLSFPAAQREEVSKFDLARHMKKWAISKVLASCCTRFTRRAA